MKIGPAPKRTHVERVESPLTLVCVECNGPMRLLRLVNNETQGTLALFYGCAQYPRCYCTHSAHPDGTPMGKPANAATRAARHHTHLVFDRLWKNGGHMTRSAAYRWLAEQFGAEAHMGSMDLDDCVKAMKLANAKLTELAHERRKIEQRRKREKKFVPQTDRKLAERKQRAERHDQKIERQHRTEPPKAPKPEPEEKPPRCGYGRAELHELLAIHEEAGAIVLAEGVRLGEEVDWQRFEEEEVRARLDLFQRSGQSDAWRKKGK